MQRTSMGVGLCLVGLLGALGIEAQEPVRPADDPVGERERPEPLPPLPTEPASPAEEEKPGVSVPLGSVPRLLKFAGTMTDERGQPQTGLVGVTFALYEEQEGGTPVRPETQNVELGDGCRTL